MFNEKAAPMPSSEQPASPAKKAPPTAWKKGVSGNPRGRPKSDFTLRDLAQTHSREGLERVVAVMRDPDTKPETVLTAVGMLWDRGFGRAPNSLDVTHKLGISDEFEQLLRQIQGQRHNAVQTDSPDMKVINDAAYAIRDGEQS